MSGYKNIFILLCLWLISCKPSSLAFDEETQLAPAFFANIPAIAQYPELKIDSIRVYKARLEEMVVERDAVTEYKLINIESKKPTVDYPIIGDHHNLYIFRIFSSPDKRLSVFLSASFAIDGFSSKCISLGPAYLGFERIDRYNMNKLLKVSKQDSSYLLTERSGKFNMFFYAENEITPATERFRLYQLIDKGKNKIAGTKPVIYNVKKVFNDANALVFLYDHTIRY
jgi:hypothetical protein